MRPQAQVQALPHWRGEPAAVFSRLADRPGAVWFDSAAGGGTARVSLLACEPETVLEGELGGAGCDGLRRWLRDNAVGAGGEVSFPLGGAFGSISYEGWFRFGLYRHLLVYRHDGGEWLEVGRARHWVERTGGPAGVRAWEGPEPLRFEAEGDRSGFERAVRRAQEYIAAGDIYQVNLAQGFVADWPPGVGPWVFYRALRRVSPAPFAAYVNLGGATLLSSSPEQFLRFSGWEVETRPIKGTRPRHADGERDRRSARELLESEKERAELVMITDLERNDLGQFCEFGSVEAPEVARLESFEQVYHLVSTVRGRMRREFDQVSALALAYPGGSITGAPKKRAMEIIRELEGRPRGAYTGVIGYFGLNGESQFNIAIRTAVLEGGRLEFRVGAGIVADSDPGAEYEETLHKAAGLFRAGEMWGREEERVAREDEFRRMGGDDGIRPALLRRA